MQVLVPLAWVVAVDDVGDDDDTATCRMEQQVLAAVSEVVALLLAVLFEPANDIL